MTQSDIGIVEKLLAFDRGIPDFIGDKYPTCETVSHRNPDGPEAAAIIMEMVEVLERFKRIALRKDMSAAAKVACIESIAHTTLAKVRGK